MTDKQITEFLSKEMQKAFEENLHELLCQGQEIKPTSFPVLQCSCRGLFNSGGSCSVHGFFNRTIS